MRECNGVILAGKASTGLTAIVSVGQRNLDSPRSDVFPAAFCQRRHLRRSPRRRRHNGSTLVAVLPESTRQRAFYGDGHARFDIAREFGHTTLRHLETWAALLDKYPPEGQDSRKVLVSASSSLDFQANVFAASLLISDDVDPGSASPEELSLQYGIDVLSARVYFAEIPSVVPQPPLS